MGKKGYAALSAATARGIDGTRVWPGGGSEDDDPCPYSAPMVIVAGHITVDPERRESYLARAMRIVEKARQADACRDFAITADLLDTGRVNLYEPWESQAAVTTFRRRAPRNKHGTAMLSASVAEYDTTTAH
jgi:quinol monooxygenase YgiN